MTFSGVIQVYRSYGVRDFYGRAMRRLSDFAVPQISYSQAGEDRIVDNLFESVGVCLPRYLEIGTNHPKEGNNTYFFYRRGCSGVLVEANPSFAKLIRRKRARDHFYNIGISPESGVDTLDFYAFKQSGHSTFDKTEAEIRLANGCVLHELCKIPVMTINEILTQEFPYRPDFLSIDIEGLDLPVLKSLDYERYPIPVICAETCSAVSGPVKDHNIGISDFLETKGYFLYAHTYINSIFVNRKWFEERNG